MNDVVERVARAIEAARCPDREGPYGGYDYGHNNPTPPKDGRYVVRDFRDPGSDTWGAWVHQTNDRAEHEAAYERLTQEHIARAAIEAMRELSPEMVDAFLSWVPIGALPRTGWSAVIDAALADASPDIGKEGIGNE